MALGKEVGLGPGHIVLDGDPAPPPQKLGHNPHFCGPFRLWPNCWMHQDATWYGSRPRPRPHCARWGPSSPKKEHSRQFSAHVNYGQTVGWIKMPLSTEIGLGPGDCVRWGPSSLHKKGRSPQFAAHAFCGQTAAWIKMPLGTEVGIGLRDIVLDGKPAPPS